MPKLSEFIGSLVSSITDARVISDMQTVRVAEEYAKHQLLMHFPIPKMCIEEIEMTIPIALDTLEPKSVRSYKINDIKKFNDLVFNELVKGLGFERIPNEIVHSLKNEVTEKSQSLEKDLQRATNLTALKDFSKSISIYFLKTGEKNSLIKKEHQINIETVQNNLEHLLSKEITQIANNDLPENVNVIVESHKLQKLKSENLIFIKMKISEDGMEWHRMENSKGEIERRLLPA